MQLYQLQLIERAMALDYLTPHQSASYCLETGMFVLLSMSISLFKFVSLQFLQILSLVTF